MCIDYKEIDRRTIIEFILKKGGEVDVEVILAECAAEKLRVYPILFEETQAGHIEVVKETKLGAPQTVRIKK